VFIPFQRLGDRDNNTGVGLGLALARGLAEAMAGTLSPDTTPGGGLTMILALPSAAATITDHSSDAVELTDRFIAERIGHPRAPQD
jgi:two-component system sensor histidine kinase KdpD